MLIELYAVAEFRELRPAVLLDGIPLDGCTHDHAVGLLRGKRLAESVAGFPPHCPMCSGKIAYRAVTRTVREKRSREPVFLRGLDMLDQHGRYPVAVHFHFHCMIVGKQVYILFRIDERLLLAVLVIGRRLGIAFNGVAELPDHPSEAFVRTHFRVAAEVDTYFGTVIAAEDRTVID